MSEPLEFTVEEWEHLPTEVRTVVEELKKSDESRHRSLTSAERTYLIIVLGQRPTGGYTINVNRLEQADDSLHVYAEEEGPPEDALVTQVISYPFIVISVPGQFAEDDVHIHLDTAEKD